MDIRVTSSLVLQDPSTDIILQIFHCDLSMCMFLAYDLNRYKPILMQGIYIAFISGQRFAVNEEKTVLSYLIRNFNIESVDKREDVHPLGEVITRPEKGIWVKLTKR